MAFNFHLAQNQAPRRSLRENGFSASLISLVVMGDLLDYINFKSTWTQLPGLACHSRESLHWVEDKGQGAVRHSKGMSS